MPELPEVEVLVRHLGPLMEGRCIRSVEVRRQRVIRPNTPGELGARLAGARVLGLQRRGKYLLFSLRRPGIHKPFHVLAHLGMTGRIYLQPRREALPKHAAVVLQLDRGQLVFEDTRYFGRFTLDTGSISALGPEPLSADFTLDSFAAALRRSSQPIKVKLLDQSVLAGVGNIYASEALFRSRISPRVAARRLKAGQLKDLHRAIREVLDEAIRFGSTVPLDWSGADKRDGLFYYGRPAEASDDYAERLRVYDRVGQPCSRCRTPIRRIAQASRSTFFCPHCQRG
jgi:formamidopyrimidine-DNA glycosylase